MIHFSIKLIEELIFNIATDFVNRDPDLNAYLRVFMNTVTSSYRIAELIGKN